MEQNKNISVFSLAWPIFFQILLAMALGYVDTAMMSHYSKTAVGALGNANQIMNFLALAFSIVASATGVVSAQYLGAGKMSHMNQIYTLSIAFNLGLSLIVSALIILLRVPLLLAMRVPENMTADAAAYMQITGYSLFAVAITSTFSQIFNCNKNTLLGLVIAIGMNLFNILGNYLFLYGSFSSLNLGIRGVAISTCASRILGMFSGFIFFYVVIKGRISLKYINPFPFSLLKKLIKLGIPTAGENISYNIAQILISAFVNTMGAVPLTAKIFCSILTGFSLVYSNAMAGATAIITGHAIGRDDYDFAYRLVWKSLFIAIIVSVSVAMLNWLLSPHSLKLFTEDENIVSLGSKVMFIAVFLEAGRCVNLVIIRSMRASGDVVFPTLLGICSMWGVSVLFSWFLGIYLKMGLVGVWISMAADEVLRALIVIVRWKLGLWRGKSVVEKS